MSVLLKLVQKIWRGRNIPNSLYEGIIILLPKLEQDNAASAAKSLQSCSTLCDPTDGSPPGSPVPGILQARTLEWVAISFSNAWKLKVKVKLFSRVWLFATPWTSAYQAPLSMGFSRQEYWSGMPLSSLNRTLHRRKLQTNIPDEYRCKNSQENTSKLKAAAN